MADMVISGRNFVHLANSTFEHDIWMTRKVREAGLATAIIHADEGVQDFAERLTGEVLASGVALELLGGIFVPEGTAEDAWTPAMAAETAAVLGKVTDVATKTTLRAQIASMLVYFFVNGVASLRTSLKSSPPTTTGKNDGPSAPEGSLISGTSPASSAS